MRNVNRTVGTMLGHEVTKRFGGAGLPDDTIDVTLTGSAGQSFGAFLPRGITLRLFGDANDYVGKGLSGGRIVVRPDRNAALSSEHNVVAGNVIGYGATTGQIFLRGLVGERFGVRNSGATLVVEGVGDHGCEYMTGGTVLVLGRTGRNFGAGMSGGTAYVLDLVPALVNVDAVRTERARARPARRRGRRAGARRSCARTSRRPARRSPPSCSRTSPRPGRGSRACCPPSTPASVARSRRPRPTASTLQRPACGTRSWRWPVADPRGFLKVRDRELPPNRPVEVRLRDWKDVHEHLQDGQPYLKEQAGRCMDCGIPFCHNGCPLGNLIPEWNDLVWRGQWSDAIDRLHATNNFPEFTGRICPAPCESSCVLGINQPAVTIKNVEVSIIDEAFERGWSRRRSRSASPVTRSPSSAPARPVWPPRSS